MGGFNRSQVIVVVPEKIQNVIDSDTKVVSITVRDPLSKIHHYSLLNPLGGESYSSLSFKKLSETLKAKKRGCTVVVEGPGAWQLTAPKDRSRFAIDHVIVGEYTTSAIPRIFEKIVAGNDVPDVISAPPTTLEEVPTVRGGVTEGLIEAARGCNRSCRFCTVPRIRCRPFRDIVEEAEVNLRYGKRDVTLRSDDIFTYGARGLEINQEAVLRLY
ncbi:hypothetical protein AC480_02370 [miscellaneous Crenarchaeota group archaeon SMTZ1-55]|nr:MAG: hypothetical protein AC480_02370 [miscellaneous Crenarchaeota group archaeon SMTZ1-55]